MHRFRSLIAVLTIGATAVVLGAGQWLAPCMHEATPTDEGRRLAESVCAVRSIVGMHRHSMECRTNASGWPVAISPQWFPGGELPSHGAGDQPVTVEVVDEAPDVLAPLQKVFVPNGDAIRVWWYNRTNGAICARVGINDDVAETLRLFNDVNGLSFRTLDQVRSLGPELYKPR